MIDKFFRTASFVLLRVVLLSLIIFSGLTSSDALTRGFSPENSLSLEFEGEDSQGVLIGPSEDSQNLEVEKPINNMTMEEIFGDEQVFPWEPGLGNHAS